MCLRIANIGSYGVLEAQHANLRSEHLHRRFLLLGLDGRPLDRNAAPVLEDVPPGVVNPALVGAAVLLPGARERPMAGQQRPRRRRDKMLEESGPHQQEGHRRGRVGRFQALHKLNHQQDAGAQELLGPAADAEVAQEDLDTDIQIVSMFTTRLEFVSFLFSVIVPGWQ